MIAVIACVGVSAEGQAQPEGKRSVTLRWSVTTAHQESTRTEPSADGARVAPFLAGAAAALAAHEAGHLLFDIAFDAHPGIGRVEFHGIPFFAVTHRSDLSRRREFTISSAGFWVQHATDEWLLTRRPPLKHERAPFRKGMLTFNIATSVAYSAAAFARTGPVERDTRGMADSIHVNERWIGLLILAPAVLDAWRYLQPEARTPVWLSRGVKVAGVVLVLK